VIALVGDGEGMFLPLGLSPLRADQKRFPLLNVFTLFRGERLIG